MYNKLRDAITRRRSALDKNTIAYGYGPDMNTILGADLKEPDGYVWACGRCVDGNKWLRNMQEAAEGARRHAATHSGMTVIEKPHATWRTT